MRQLLYTGMLTTLMALAAAPQAYGQLSAHFSQDTLFSCLGVSHGLSPVVQGASGAVSYVWDDASTQSVRNVVLLHADTLNLYVTVRDANGGADTARISVIGLAECVWPGDANGDGLANHTDLLAIGQAFAQQGPRRPQAHHNWIGQAAPGWGRFTHNHADLAHADADGNGAVSWADIQLIAQHYAFVPRQVQAQPVQGTPLYLNFPAQVFNPGDTVRIGVMLGTAAQPADSVYGIAFSLGYEALGADAASVEVRFDSSWMGTQGIDLAAISHYFPQPGQLDIALTRVNQQTRSGHGQIAEIIITIDDLGGKNGSITQLALDFGGASLIDARGAALPVQSISSSIGIAQSLESGIQLPRMQLFPNPARHEATLQYPARSLRIYAPDGRLVHSQQSTGLQALWSLKVAGWPAGCYTLEAFDGQKISHFRLMVNP